MLEYINENGEAYTEDEINQFAKDNNSSFEDVLKKNKLTPKQKKQKVSPGKINPVAKKGAIVTEKNTASKSEPTSSASKKRKSLFEQNIETIAPERNLTFEESMNKAIKTKQNKDKVAADVQKSLTSSRNSLVSNITGQPNPSTERSIMLEKSDEDNLKKLQEQGKQTEFEQSKMEARYAKAALAKNNKDFLAQTKPSEDYILEVDDEIKNKVTADGTDETYMVYGKNDFTAPEERTRKINSFPEEKKEVITELQKAGTLSKYNEKAILGLAAEKYKKKKLADYVNDKTVSFYTNTSEETKNLFEDYNKKNAKFLGLDLEKKATVNGLIYDHLNKTANEIIPLEKKLKSYGTKPIFKTQKELDDYKEIYDEYNSLRSGANELLTAYSRNNNAIGSSKEKLQSAEKEYDLAKRNYGFLTGAGVRTFGAFADMGGSVIQLANLFNPISPIRDAISEYVALSTREGQEMRDAYLGQQEKITDITTFGKASFNVIASQLPNWLLMYATGGGAGAAEKAAALGAKEIGETALLEGAELTAKQIAEKTAADIGLGAFKTVAENNQYAKLMDLAINRLALSPELASIAAISGGQKYSEQVASNALGETNFTPLQMLSSSVLYGYAEGLSEKITLDILKGGGRTLEALVKQDDKFVSMLKDKTVSDWFGSSAKFAGKKVTDFANENVSEQFANLAQNSIDKFILGKNVNLLDNTGSVFKDTSLLSAWMISAPHVAGLAIKPFLGKDQTKEIKQNSSEIARIVDLLKNPDLSSDERNIFKNKIKELSTKSETTFKNTIKDIDGMPNNTFKTILTKSNELGTILQKAKTIYNSDSPNKVEVIKILEEQYKQKETELNSLVGRTKMISKLDENYSNEDKAKLFNLNNEEADLKNEINVLKNENNSDAILIEKNNQLKNVKEKIIDVHANALVTKFTNRAVKAAESAELDQNIFQFATSEEAEAKANELKQSMIDSDGKRSEGLEIDGTIIIDREQAAKTRALNVAGHEILHKFLRKTLYKTIEIKDENGNVIGSKLVGSNAVKGMAEAMQSYLNKIDTSILDNKDFKARVELYKDKPESVKAEEILTLFSDALALKQIELNESSLTKIGDYIRRVLQDLGFINIEFKDGKDVLNFLKDYNSALEKGKMGRALKKASSEGIKVGEGIKKYTDDYNEEAKASKTKVAEVQAKIDKLEDQFDNDEIEYDDYTNRLTNLEADLKKAKAMPEEEAKPKTEIKPKIELSPEDEVKEIIKNDKGSVSSDKVQKIYEEKGLEGAQDIINLFKPITKKIVDKRRDAPDFDRELLTDEIETGVGGILDLIKSYKVEKGVPLAAYINKQLPLRAIATSRRLLGKEFSKDVAEEKGLMAEEAPSEVKEKPIYKNALESKVFSPEVIKTMIGKILTNMRTLKSRIDEPVSLNRTITPLIAEIRDAMGKQLDIDVKTAMGGKKDNEFKNWLLKNKRYMLENMTTTWLMAKDGQGGIPQAIQKQIDGKWVSYPDWVGQKIDRETTSTDQAGRTSGAELVRRLPNVFNNVSDIDYLGQFIGPDGNPIRGRKESGAKAVAEEIAFDIVNNDLAEEGDIYNALSSNQQRLGYEELNNFAVEFSRQSERGNIKRSKAVRESIEDINNLPIDIKNMLIGPDGNRFTDYTKSVRSSGQVEKQFKISYKNIDLPEEYKNKILKSIKTLYRHFEKNKLNTKLMVFKIKEGENFEKYANRIVFNALSKEQSIALTLGISVNDLRWKDGLNRINAQSHIDDFINNAVESLTSGENKISNDQALLALTRIFSRSFAHGQKRSLYGTQSDFYNRFLKDNNKFALKEVSDGKFTITYNEGKVNREIPQQDTSSIDIAKYIKEGNINAVKFEDRSKATKTARGDFKEMMNLLKNMYQNKKITDIQLGLIFKSLGGNMNSVLKLSSELRYLADRNGYSNDPKDWVYEHTPPSSYLSRLAIGVITGKDNMSIDDFMQKLIENSYVAIIPKSVDNDVNSLYKSTMPFNYAIGDNPLIRYYDAGFKGFAMPALYDLKENKLINRDIVRNEFNFPNVFETQEAVLNSLSTVKRSKGISVFDFDDTVGLTKSNVLYTMPDGSTGKLNGAEFAKEGSRLLNEGAEFDFSEFSKVVEGKPGPMVEKMKKMIGKFGPENFFILTARPADSAVPIHQFLASIGIDIPLENITGLGNSAAQAKADWITNKAAEGYNDFYFTDDHLPNVEAVKKALDIPGVDSKVQQALVKFSLTSKQDLKWNIADSGGITYFNVNNKEYSIILTNTGNFGYGDKDQRILDNLIKKYNLEDEEANLLGSYEGGTLNLVFSDFDGDVEITGAGNAFEVFGTVINGVLDYVKSNETEGLIFTAAEPSRKKLYNAMAAIYANKLGWNAFYEDGVYIISKYPVREMASSFSGQPKQVKDVLNVVDVKSEIQQARAKFSKSLDKDFNQIIEDTKGTENYKVFSDVVARKRGAKKNKFDFYVPPSAADFELLLYNFMGKGTKGEEHREFFANALLKPYTNGNDLMDAARQSIKREYKKLNKAFPEIQKTLETLTPDGDFTYDQAIRVSIWNDNDIEIPGLSQRDKTKLTNLVNNDPELNAFKQGLIVMGRQGKGWVVPGDHWDSSTIISDLHNLTEGSGRKKFLGEFIENTEAIFGKFENGKLVGPNMNKIEAVYGTNVREALDDSIYRMINGKNRSFGSDRETSMWSNWVNGSTGTIMFLNTRSAALQLLGSINFLNFRDNNPYTAAKAFANQPQYWKDFARIWNSDKMKERRGGLKEDVAASEIANAAAGSKNKVGAVVSYLLKIGYTPTMLADSFAIASGGAPYYRNRIKSYLKEGMTEAEAEKAAWQDFTKVSDETQQSGDPKDISKQQASGAGRLLLTFQNTAMQQSRIVKKAVLDLKNGRGDAKTNVSKIVYYLTVQNLIFSALQQGLFAVAFDDDEDDDKEKEKKIKTRNEKLLAVGDGVLDSILRGTGFIGGITATAKNMILKYIEERDKKQADYAKVVLEGANISPPIGSKLKKLYSGLNQTKYDKDLIKERGWGVMQDGRVHLGPMYSVTGKVVESTTNLPMDRLANKIENVSQALNAQNSGMQRLMIAAGWSPYSVGVEDTPGDIKIKAEGKATRKEEGKIKTKQDRENKKDSIEKLPMGQQLRIKLKNDLEKMKRKRRKMG